MTDSDPKTTLYLVRHGETVWNTEKRAQGWQDSPLTERGIEQARRLAERLRPVRLDAIYASPSGRTMHTAAILRGDRALVVTPCEELREIHMGDWEGRRIDELDGEAERLHNFWYAPHLFQPAGAGETFAQLQARVVAAVSRLVAESAGSAILLVSHGGALKALLAHYAGRPLAQLWAPPILRQASLSVVEIEGQSARIVLEGDTSHLAE
jgi:broad specificity phosphatase PhoE